MKKIILAISLLAVVAGAIGWPFLRPAKPIVIHGNLSARDLVEIRRIVRRELRKTILPDFSWKSLKGLPANLWNYIGYQVMEIDASGNSSNVLVMVRPSRKPTASLNIVGYRMFKDAVGWNTDVTILARSSFKIYHAEIAPTAKTNQLSPSAGENAAATPITFDQNFADLLPETNGDNRGKPK